MQFTVPQFIEREPRIIGPLSLRQFIFVGSGGALCFILWFTYGKNHFFLYIMMVFVIAFLAIALAFVRINGLSLPTVIKNIFVFYITPKLYLWKRKEVAPKMMVRHTIKKVKKEDEEPGPVLKFSEGGHLRNLAKELETKQ